MAAIFILFVLMVGNEAAYNDVRTKLSTKPLMSSNLLDTNES
jgi:hypothetical protein